MVNFDYFVYFDYFLSHEITEFFACGLQFERKTSSCNLLAVLCFVLEKNESKITKWPVLTNAAKQNKR